MSSAESGNTRPSPASGLAHLPLTRANASADDASFELAVGQRLGPFELRELLGSGGMGQVFLADQMEPVQRQVALKFMQHRLSGSLAPVRFEIERQALARMSHPAIAQVYEAGTTADGFPYLAMEYVPGEPIDRYCQRRGLDLAARLGLFIRVALGVQHAHQRSILHLDLKPANLLVAEVDGVPQPKIIDFGLAASAVRIPGQRGGLALAGTPGYMSPEQAGIALSGEPADVDTRSDVYALGVVLYQLICDATPFDPGQFSLDSVEQLRRQFAEYAPVASSERLLRAGQARRARQARGDLDAVVAKAMQAERTQRYESVSDLIDDLRRYLDQRPLSARPASRRHRLQLYLRRNRVQISVASALTLTLLIGLTTATYGLIQARAERDLAAGRQRELERVTEFQQSMLAGLDPATLGQTLNATLHAQLAAALKDAADGEARLQAFDRDLQLANPTEAARQLIDVDLLARALSTIGRDLPDQPLVAAELQLAISNAYLALGRYDAALRVADDAIARFRSGLGALDVKTLRARYARAQVIKQLGRSRADLPALEQLIEDAKTAGPAARALLLQAQLLHAEVQGTEGGQLAQSVARVRELVAQHADHFGADAEPTIRATQILAMLIGRAGDLAAATPLWRRTLAQLQASKGVEDASTISAMDMLGANLALQGNNEEALPLHLRALELRRKLHGNEHPMTLQAMNSAAITLSRVGRLPEAIALATDALAIRRRTLGPDHPATLRSLLNLGAFYATAGDIPKALALTRECYDRRRATLGADNLDVYVAARNLADFELIAGDPKEGLRLASETVEQQRRLLGPQHPDIAPALTVLARALAVAGDYQRALPLLEQELLLARSDAKINPRNRATRAWYLARTYLALGRRSEAQVLIDTEMRPLLEASFEDLNPPEREALRQLNAYSAQLNPAPPAAS